MKKETHTSLWCQIIYNGTYSCNQSYSAIAETIRKGGLVEGIFLSKASASGRLSYTSVFLSVTLIEATNKIGFRYYTISANENGALSGSIVNRYMDSDGRITEQP